MSVDTATVAKIASLARIRLSETEIAGMVPELNGILAWVEQLGAVLADELREAVGGFANGILLAGAK